jgi:hypothetical protein
MAKKPTAPPGVAQMTEQEFVDLIKKQTPGERGPKVDLKAVVEKLRAENTVKTAAPSAAFTSSVKPAVTPPAEIIAADLKQKAETLQDNKHEDKRSDRLLDSHEKLISNIEKLTRVISESALNTKGKLLGGGRGEELGKEQKLDYRSLGQQFKEKIMGRGGDKFDPNSIRYKLGSLRGLAETTGLVTRGSGGLIENKLAVREERLKTASAMTKMNENMKYLPQFAGSDKAVEQYYQTRGKKTIKARAELQTQQYKTDSLREAGLSDEEIGRTKGGNKQFEARNKAAAEVINIDPRYQGEKKEDLETKLKPNQVEFAKPKEKAVQFAGPAISNDQLNVSQEEEDSLKAMNHSGDSIDKLIHVTEEENKRRSKSEAELLAAIKGMESSGGLGSMMGTLGGMGGGLPGKGAGYLSKVGGLGKLAKGVGIGGIAALAGEGIQAGGDYLKETGHESAGKAVGVGGTAVKYAGYGAMIGSVIPGVGTAIGGGIGGLIGAGKGVYDNYFADKANTATPTTGKMQAAEIPAKAAEVYNRSADNDMAKIQQPQNTSNNIVNAPTNISKQSTNNMIKVPIRDQDTSIRQYYRSRFAT